MAEKKLNDLFLDTLKDIYFAERQILKNLPKMAKAAKSAELKKAILTHRDQTEQHVERLQEVFELIGRRAQAKTCEAIKGILEEGKEIMEDYSASEALDAGLLAAAQAVEHYEMSRYGTLKTWPASSG